ncbi:hypothetical protein [Paraeggerthella sp.]|uniref:hypothetical protein n=1 Tax=Paraeggerthella sp. TaxID=2897350 RepID=UPI003529AA1E
MDGWAVTSSYAPTLPEILIVVGMVAVGRHGVFAAGESALALRPRSRRGRRQGLGA